MTKIAKESARIRSRALVTVVIILIESGGLKFNQRRPTALGLRNSPPRKEELDGTFRRDVESKVESLVSYLAEASVWHEGVISGTGRYPLYLPPARKFLFRKEVM